MCKLQQDRVKLLLLLLNHTVEKPPRLSEFWRLCCVKSLEESEGPISSGIKVHFSVGLAVWSLSGVPDDSNKLKRKKNMHSLSVELYLHDHPRFYRLCFESLNGLVLIPAGTRSSGWSWNSCTLTTNISGRKSVTRVDSWRIWRESWPAFKPFPGSEAVAKLPLLFSGSLSFVLFF